MDEVANIMKSLHVIGHIDGVQLVGQEAVSQMHALFLATRVDGYHTGIYHHDHPNDEVMVL